MEEAIDSTGMLFMIAFDTNVVIYGFDADEQRKQPIALNLLNGLATGRNTVLLWQVVAESLACLRDWERKRSY